jgi:[ribosomal protein S18]-alanine N-acetyltransferase
MLHDMIVFFEKECFSEPYSSEEIKSLLAGPGIETFFVQDNGNVTSDPESSCGYVIAQIIDDVAEIFRIGILPSARGKGLAGRLLLHLEQKLKPGERLLLEVSENNLPARKCYDSFGFHSVRKRPSYYRDGSNALIMEKRKKE